MMEREDSGALMPPISHGGSTDGNYIIKKEFRGPIWIRKDRCPPFGVASPTTAIQRFDLFEYKTGVSSLEACMSAVCKTICRFVSPSPVTEVMMIMEMMMCCCSEVIHRFSRRDDSCN